jgi:hypothetical protein
VVVERGGDVARLDEGDADAERRDFHPQGQGEGVEGGLGRGIVGLEGDRGAAGQRAHHDRAALRATQVRQGGPKDGQRAHDIGLELGARLFDGQVFHAAEDGVSGAANEGVEAAGLGHDRGDAGLRRGVVADVHHDPGVADPGGRGRGCPAAGSEHAEAVARETLRGRAADAGGGPGDEDGGRRGQGAQGADRNVLK